MSLRTKVVYTVKPYVGKVRCHIIPIEAARLALNDPEALVSSLQFRQCLIPVLVIDHGKVIARFPPAIVQPSSDNVVFCSEEQFPNYPTKLSDEAKLVVELVVID